MAAAPVADSWALLASSRSPGAYDVSAVVLRDRVRRGAVAVRARAGVARRAEPGARGPLIYEARSGGGQVVCDVWGPPGTSVDEVERALEACVGWAGLRDRPGDLAPVVAGSPVLRRLLRETGELRLSRLPRVAESLGRAVLCQLVQSAEGARSIAQVAVCAGTSAGGGLWTWPAARQLGAVPAWDLRRCGVSLRAARALHAGAVADGRLAEAVGDWPRLDRRLRALPGVGVWTSAEVRLSLGDPDATSVGDYNLPGVVGCVLGGRTRDDHAWDDAAMLELLAPFAGQRGRVIRLCERAAARGLARRPARRAPRAALSAHRYW